MFLIARMIKDISYSKFPHTGGVHYEFTHTGGETCMLMWYNIVSGFARYMAKFAYTFILCGYTNVTCKCVVKIPKDFSWTNSSEPKYLEQEGFTCFQ